MASIFTRIIKGEIPCYKVAEDEKYFAMLDVNPLVKGHTLVIPKKEIDYIFDMDDAQLGQMMIFAKKIAKAIQKVCPAPKIGMTVIGLEVPHAHIHLVPIQGVNDIDFTKEKLQLTVQEFTSLAQKIGEEYLKIVAC
ncbi:MAG: HIT family protein [Bacteroidales bacterium]